MENGNRKRFLNIAQTAVVCALILFMILMVTAGSARDIPMDEIRMQMAAQAGVNDLILKNDSGVNSALGMVPSEYLYYRTDEVMDVRELLIAKVRDDEEMEQLETAVSQHLQTQIDNYTGYGTNQVDLLEHAVTTEKGRYFFFAVGEQAEMWQDSFLQLLR